MPNDFLSSLSSRALQNPEVDSAGSRLKPRLASRFENLDAPVVPVVDQALDTESPVDPEAGENADLRNSAPGQGRTRVTYKRPVSNEGSWPGVLTVPERRSDKNEYVFERVSYNIWLRRQTDINKDYILIGKILSIPK